MAKLDTLKIKTNERKELGKKTKKLLQEDKIPAVIYNDKTESTPLAMDYGEAVRIAKEATRTTIVEVDVDGDKRKAIVKEIQKDPIKGTLIHISLFEIDEDKEMIFEIPIVPEGVAPAVKNNIGVLVTIEDSIEVKCKVKNLIPQITVDVTELETPGDHIRMTEIDIPEELKLLHEEDRKKTVITIANLQKLIIEEDEDEDEDEELEEGEEGEAVKGEEGEDGEGAEGEAAPEEGGEQPEA